MLSFTVRRLVTNYQVVSLLALQNLAHCFPAYRGLHGVLNIRNINSMPRGLLAINRDIQIRLPQNAEESQVFNTLNFAHDTDYLVALLLQSFQVFAIQF